MRKRNNTQCKFNKINKIQIKTGEHKMQFNKISKIRIKTDEHKMQWKWLFRKH